MTSIKKVQYKLLENVKLRGKRHEAGTLLELTKLQAKKLKGKVEVVTSEATAGIIMGVDEPKAPHSTNESTGYVGTFGPEKLQITKIEDDVDLEGNPRKKVTYLDKNGNPLSTFVHPEHFGANFQNGHLNV